MLIVRSIFLLSILCLALPVVVETESANFFTITKIMGIAATLLTAWAVALGKLHPRIDILSVFLVMGFTLWGWIGQMAYGETEAIYIIKMLMNLALMLMVMQFVRSPKDLCIVLCAYLCGATIESFTGILEIDPGHAQRIAGAILNANNFGQICSHAIIISLGLFSISKYKIIKALLILSCVLALIGLLFSGSRGATLALVAGLAVLFIVQSQRVKLLFFAILFTVLVISVAPSFFRERFQWAFSPEARQTVSGIDIRINLAQQGMKIFASHPILGVGMGNVVPEMFKQMGERWVTHNIFTQLLAETGLFGFLIFSYLLFRAILFLYRMTKSAISAHEDKIIFSTALAFLTVIIVAETSSGNYNRPTWFFVFGMVSGLYFSAHAKKSASMRIMRFSLNPSSHLRSATLPACSHQINKADIGLGSHPTVVKTKEDLKLAKYGGQ